MTQEIAECARRDGRVAIDTEFVSERRYQAQLCLVQVAVADADAPDGVRTDVLDPLDDQGPPDFGPLASVLADPDVEVIVHAGRQDVAILRRTWATDVKHVFDTQVAAGFLGYGNQEGYESLVRRVLGVTLKGGEGYTRWDKRPLSPKQIGYAADDARLLLSLGAEVQRKLSERGRLEWAREECAVVEESRDERSAERSYERLPKLGRLDAEGRAVARRLCEWRDRVAREMDRPPPFVAPDQVVFELARRAPTDRAALENIRGLPQQTLHRRGAELLDEIAAGRSEEPPPPPPHAPKRDSREAPLVSLAQALVRQRSLDSGIATELIATQSELAALVAALRRDGGQSNGVRALRGWRRELIGDELQELIEGRSAVSVKPGGGLSVVPHPS